MKSNLRQSSLFIGAAACIAVAAWQLLFGVKGDPPVSQGKAASSAPAASVNGAVSTDAPLTPALYQKAGKELQSVFPENPQPFRSGDMVLEMNRSKSDPSLLPLGLEGGFTMMTTGGKTPVKPKSAPEEPVVAGSPVPLSPGAEPIKESEQKPDAAPPRLRGWARTAGTNDLQALLEVNGRLVTASAEEFSEWRIIEQSDDSILVEHGEKVWIIDLNHTAEARE